MMKRKLPTQRKPMPPSCNFAHPMHRPRHSISRHAAEPRSEEHTSELQSRLHLVCRLLLEKKKQMATHVGHSHRCSVICKFSKRDEYTSVACFRVSSPDPILYLASPWRQPGDSL